MTEEKYERIIEVLMYVGPDRKNEKQVELLAKNIPSEAAIMAQDVADPVGTVRFRDPVKTVEDLARQLRDPAVRILHLVGHADREGRMTIEDVWGELDLEPRALGKMLVGTGVQAVMASTCHGAKIAEAIVDEAGAPIAIGYDGVLQNAVTLALCQGFYGALVDGASPDQAADDGLRIARNRLENVEGRFRVFTRSQDYHGLPLFGPEFGIIGTPSEKNAGVVEELQRELEPYEADHVDRQTWGDFGDNEIEYVLRSARILLVLLDDHATEGYDPDGRDDFFEKVTTAVSRARTGDVRLIPLYISKEITQPPYGMRRLVPALLHGRDVGGKVEVLADKLKQLLTQPPRRRRGRRRR